MERKTNFWLILCVLLFITAPYIYAVLAGDSEFRFGGFLLNPIDGNSYLAKMSLGYEGGWKFQLPYTAEPGEGAYLFLFYIFLGHLSRWTGIEPILMFHFFRIGGSILLLHSLGRFIRKEYIDYDLPVLHWVLALICLGSGLGWLAALLGGFTMDFWVAEAYPFLSMYSNPHFPIGLALLLLYFSDMWRQFEFFRWLLMSVYGLLLAIILPFGIVVAGVVTALAVTVACFRSRKLIGFPHLSALIPGGFLLIYQYWATLRDPVLFGWNAQNITSSPPLWDFFLSMSPALLVGLFGIYLIKKTATTKLPAISTIWLISAVVLAYYPFALQRRFLLGVFIPIGILASVGLFELAHRKVARFKRFFSALILVSILTNVLIIAGGISAISEKNPNIYLYAGEYSALAWMEKQSHEKPVIFASPETGLIIPAYSGWRVYYGHPFETVDAENHEQETYQVLQQLAQSSDPKNFWAQNRITHIFWGPREWSMTGQRHLGLYPVIYKNDQVEIYLTGYQP